MILESEEKKTEFHKSVRGKINPKKITVSIPYKKRLKNIEVVFEALTHQTMSKDDFEVIIGAMDYCESFISLCNRYINKLNIITVLSPDEFFIPCARNLAMRQATGQIIIQMDADTLLPPNTLQNLYDSHFAFGQKICVVGQVVGYGNNNDGVIESVEELPYESYKSAINDLEQSTGKPKDPRFQVHHAIPWAFGWTGFIAIPLEVIRKNDLYFDETFTGWGVDDLEWSYRICSAGIPIVLSENIRAIHLPHVRDPEANRKTEILNYRRFLLKWPSPDVELSHSFGDIQANALYLDFMADRKKILSSVKEIIGVARGSIEGKITLIIGIELNNMNQIINTEIIRQFDSHISINTYPLIGIGLPFNDKEIDECRILHPISLFTEKYAPAVYKEAKRVSKKIILPHDLNSKQNFKKVV